LVAPGGMTFRKLFSRIPYKGPQDPRQTALPQHYLPLAFLLDTGLESI
jgi:hypothetical protein